MQRCGRSRINKNKTENIFISCDHLISITNEDKYVTYEINIKQNEVTILKKENWSKLLCYYYYRKPATQWR